MTTDQILSQIRAHAIDASIKDDTTAGYRALDALDKQLDVLSGKCKHHKGYEWCHKRNRLARRWLDVQQTVSDAKHGILMVTGQDHDELMTPVITATITARGAASSTANDFDDGSVDADVFADGELIGQVTLCRDRQNDLRIWGDRDMWASELVIAWLNRDEEHDLDFYTDRVASIVDAVQVADGRTS
jgi:hypothetical protein